MNPLLLILILILVLGIAAAVIISVGAKKAGYQPVLSVQNLNDLARNFVFDNPNGNATDPTQGSVNYAWFMDKDATIKDAANPLQIVPNVNGNVFWQNINLNNANIKAANWANRSDGGFTIRPSPGLIDGGVNVGSYRLGSKNFFKGGLFVFELKSVPSGCYVWPAIWLNGFVGMPNHYRFEPSKNGEKMEKINAMYQKTYTLTNVVLNNSNEQPTTMQGYQPHQCTSLNQVLSKDINSSNPLVSGMDVPMSQYLGRPVYPARWPAQGEIDIIETIKFRNNTTVSFHSGPFCRPTSSFTMGSGSNQAQACGNTDYSFGNYSGCQTNLASYGYPDSAQDSVGGQNMPVCGSSPGNTQINTPAGTYGVEFNKSGGGVYVCQWIPGQAIYVWMFPYAAHTKESLTSAGGPLSSSPNPSASWNAGLVADFQLAKGANTGDMVGCDMSYMEIVINLTFGGAWAGQPGDDCPLNGATVSANDYLKACFGQNNSNCQVPAGIQAGPYQYMDMSFGCIKVFQNPDTDDMF